MSILQRRLVRVAAAAVAVVGWGAVIVAPTGASAAIVTTPGDLSPGDQCRLAFVSSTTRDATSSNIGDYNAHVQAAADAIPELFALGATWKAIGSTGTVDARDNTDTLPLSAGGTIGVPIYLLDETRIAANNADFWDGSIISPFNIFENGDPTPIDVNLIGLAPWTGTISLGTKQDNFLGPHGIFLPVLSVAGCTTCVSSTWVRD